MADRPVGHRLNHQGSCTPQIMENIAGDAHYGVLIRVADGGATAFKNLRPPDEGASGAEVAAYVAARTTGADVVETFNLSTLPGNPLWLPVNTWNGVPGGIIDDHFGLACGVDYLDRVWISGNARANYTTNSHSGGLHWVVYDPADGDFDDPAAWSDPGIPTVISDCGTNTGHTYHHYRRLSDGTLLVFLSQHDEPSGQARGRDFLAFYLNADTSGAWAPLITTRLPAGADTSIGALAPRPPGGGHLCQSCGSPNTNINNDASLFGGPANRSYINAVHVERKSPTVDRLHVLGIWRTADSDGHSSFNPYYVYCDNPVDNSTGWKTITGASQPMPIAWVTGIDNRVPSATVIPIGTIQNSIGGSIAIDENGYPHFIMENGGGWDGEPLFKPDTTIPLYDESIYTDSTGNYTALMHVWWDGSAWQKRGLQSTAWGSTGGPNIARVAGAIYMLAAFGHYESRVLPNFGEDVVSNYAILGRVPHGSELNYDPVSMTQRGELAVMTPFADDVPKLFWWGKNKSVGVNLDAMNTYPDH